MTIKEALGYIILIGGGIGIYKLMGGLKGIQDLFSGVTTVFKEPSFVDPKGVLTETKQLEQQYQELSIPAQELAQSKLAIQQVEEALETSPQAQYLGFMADYFGWVPFIGDIAKATEGAISTKITGIETASELKYMKASQPQPSPKVETGLTGKASAQITQYKTGVTKAMEMFKQKYGRYPGE